MSLAYNFEEVLCEWQLLWPNSFHSSLLQSAPFHSRPSILSYPIHPNPHLQFLTSKMWFSRNSTILCLSDWCMRCFSISPSSDPNFGGKNHLDSGHVVSEFIPTQRLTIPLPSSSRGLGASPTSVMKWICYFSPGLFDSCRLFPFHLVLYSRSACHTGISLQKSIN